MKYFTSDDITFFIFYWWWYGFCCGIIVTSSTSSQIVKIHGFDVLLNVMQRRLNSWHILMQDWPKHFYYAPPPESGGVLCYTLRNFECPSVRPSVRASVRPSIRPSAPTTILVSATPPTVLGQSFWNFTGVLRMVWRYAYCFFRILKLFFITFFPFLT